jgi:uncharacterized membrane protein YdjX (TVP38/TMEM64 family)
MTKLKLILVLVLIAMIAVFLGSGLWDYFTLEYFKSRQAEIESFINVHPVRTGITYAAVYIILTSLSLPVAGIMTLISGALFGLRWGLLLVSIASSLGATLAFLLSRYLFRDMVQQRFADRLHTVNEGIRNDGAVYLFMLRMVPVFPYFVLNAAMALTPIKTRIFFPVTLIGMLPVSAIMVNAGLQISRIDSMADILSVRIILSLALIGIFPLLVKKIFALIRQRKAGA